MPTKVNAKEKILEAADELFGTTGFDATTTREIAAASGVNKALIHYHFTNKDLLLEAVLDRYYEKLGQTVLGSLGGEGTVRERAHRLVDTYVDFLAENRSFSSIIQKEAAAGRHVDRIGQRMVPMFQMGTTMLADAYPKTRDGEMAAAQLLVSFYGMVVSYFAYSNVLEQLLDTDPLSEEALAVRKRHLCRMLDVILTSLEQGETEGVPA